MMYLTGLLCLVAALVSTVSCEINCTQCENRNGMECDSPTNVSCPYGCATISEYCNAQCRPVPSIKRDCADQTLTVPITLAFSDSGQLWVQVHGVPCFEHGCNKNTPYRYNPEDLGPPNGLYCESCFVENCEVNYCNSSDRVQCREGQTKCLSFSGRFERGNGAIVNYASKGCVNAAVCVLKFDALFATKVLVERSFECTDATPNERDCSGC